ncbi:lipoprotein [Spiroplasma eriocheiris]|uniref:Lipoprotein n=1 Tax=Spiroplasma eriocheiris TaxID=315358 RepID=A0A0H3XJC5_9MOLU|nr:lipoprotein [Spiroplasma eriocheiris]AHF58252.1 hypothetical protein SPE_1138 [Spiroplasma eriocheiris CCTCC M 207170]AKM54690.1 hypothetical protein SERIO_v1c11370 [Spiroplasma eriocheiris]
MKKLLSILGSVTLIGSSTPALASCAGNHHSNIPPEPDTIDQVINDVIKKVRGEFLIGGQNKYLNAGDIKEGDSILQLLDQNYGKKQEILLTDQKITTAFNTVVQNVLRAISQNLLKDSIFKSYFTSIPVDKILVFNPAKTVYKQEPLLWKPGGDQTFGIPKDQYQKILQDSNITSLDKIWTNVSFSLNIKDLRTGKIIQHTSDTNTNFLLANQGADIANLISESGKKLLENWKKPILSLD